MMLRYTASVFPELYIKMDLLHDKQMLRPMRQKNSWVSFMGKLNMCTCSFLQKLMADQPEGGSKTTSKKQNEVGCKLVAVASLEGQALQHPKAKS